MPQETIPLGFLLFQAVLASAPVQHWLILREASPADQVHFYSQYFLQMWDIPQETLITDAMVGGPARRGAVPRQAPHPHKHGQR